MELYKANGRPTKKAPSEHFGGDVWQDVILQTPEPASVDCLRVRFAPGGRTNWHTHPKGQTLHVVSGVGRFQTEGEPVQEILPGDTIWIPPGEKHWHGAAPDSFMEHIAFQERENGIRITWMEPVSEDDYNAAPA
jgi:quercetin dioxygenase-like cupin family protein